MNQRTEMNMAEAALQELRAGGDPARAQVYAVLALAQQIALLGQAVAALGPKGVGSFDKTKPSIEAKP